MCTRYLIIKKDVYQVPDSQTAAPRFLLLGRTVAEPGDGMLLHQLKTLAANASKF